MRKILALAICAVLILFVTFTSFAKDEALSLEKRADIKKLLEMTNSLKLAHQISDFFVVQMTQIIKQNNPNIPPGSLNIIRDEVNSVVTEAIYEEGGYIELVTRLYHRHYTHEDIKALIEFYQTDVGKKTIRITPNLVQESMAIGSLWGKGLGPRIQERLIQSFKEQANIDLSI